MPEYRVEFPDGQAWKITIKGKKGDDALRAAHTRAASARAAEGDDSPASFEDCIVEQLTPQVRARLKGLTYLTAEQLLQKCIEIGTEYEQQGMALTVRGMYYQLVSRGFLPSGQNEYGRVKNLLAKARLKGDFPLGLLSDSSRTLHVGDATRYDLDVDRAINQSDVWIRRLDRFFIQVNRWYRQPSLPIVLFEKEALSNVFGPLCRQLGVSWMATKGYPSVSTLYELHKLMKRAADRDLQEFGDLDHLDYGWLQDLDPTQPRKRDEDESEREQLLRGHAEAMTELQSNMEWDGYWTGDVEEDGEAHEHDEGTLYRYRYGDLSATEWHQGGAQVLRLLYFGDHDPDGMEIPHDLERRLRIIQVRDGIIIPFTVERLGLNRDQIEEYDPPPFWAKPSSSRHGKYLAEHPWAQNRAWELDALDPPVLRALTEDAVEGYFDEGIHEANQDAVEVAREAFNERLRTEILPALIE